MYRLWTKTHFDAAHYIRDYEGKCRREHGHRWEVGVLLEGSELDNRNMLVDFATVKSELRELADKRLDHTQLNEALGEPNVTAEFLAQRIYQHLEGKFMAKLVRVCVWESPDCCIEYKPEG